MGMSRVVRSPEGLLASSRSPPKPGCRRRWATRCMGMPNSSGRGLVFGSAYFTITQWPQLRSHLQRWHAAQWEVDTGSGLYCQWSCSREEAEELSRLMVEHDPGFELVDDPAALNPQQIGAVIEAYIVPPDHRVTHYLRASQWKECLPLLERAGLHCEFQEAGNSVAIGILPRDRKALRAIIDAARKAAAAKRPRHRVYVVSFSIERLGLDGACAVAARNKSQAMRLFLAKAKSLSEKGEPGAAVLRDVAPTEISIDGVSTLTAYEEQMQDTLSAEEIPKPDEAILLDIGS